MLCSIVKELYVTTSGFKPKAVMHLLRLACEGLFCDHENHFLNLRFECELAHNFLGVPTTLAKTHDFFIAQANIMSNVATTFGRALGPLNKMPNPQIGCVLPPNGNVKAVCEGLQKTKRLMSRNNPIIQCNVGKEDMKNEEVVDNIMTVYNTLVAALPNEKHNIKNAYLKLTMSEAFMIGGKQKKEKLVEKEKTGTKPAEKKSEKKGATEKKPDDKKEPIKKETKE